MDVARRGRVVAQLATQGTYVNVHGLRGTEPVRIPHLGNEGVSLDELAGVLEEYAQELELLHRQLDALSRA